MIITNKVSHPYCQRNVSLQTTVKVKVTVHLKNKTKRTVEEHNRILTEMVKEMKDRKIPVHKEIKEIHKATKSPVKKEEVSLPEKMEMTKIIKETDKANKTETKKDKKDKELKVVKKTKATKTVKVKTAKVLQIKDLTDINLSVLTANLFRKVVKEVREVKDQLIGTTFLMKKRRI